MADERQCPVCEAGLVGPLAPAMALSYPATGEEVTQVKAQAWVCTACGLVHWYGESKSLARLQHSPDEFGEHKAVPGSSYERRTQVQRMLRRVRRM